MASDMTLNPLILYILYIIYLLMNPSLLRLKIIINYRLTIENNADDSRV